MTHETDDERRLREAAERVRAAFRLAAPAMHNLTSALVELTQVAARQLGPLVRRERDDA